jgi:catecholate siderophore receptor
LLRHRLLACSALALVTVCAAAAAAQAQGTAQAPVELPAVSVEGQTPAADSYKPENSASPKFPEPLLDTPRTITVIPKAVIEQRGATSMTEVLRTVPGISLGAGEGGIAAGDRTFIRGYDARGDLFVDGARDFGAYFRDPFNLEQVEILKGPASAYTGRGSTGGSINQISKTPREESFYSGALTLGTDLTRRATIDFNQAVSEGVAVRLNAMGHDAEVAGRDDVEQQRWGVAPSITFGLGRPTQVTASYFHLNQDNIPDYGHPFDPATGKPVNVDRDNFYGLVNRDFDEAQADIGTLRLDHELNDMFKFRNQTRYGQTTRNFIVSKPEYAAGASTVTRANRSRDSEDTILLNQSDLTSVFDTGFINHTLVAGIELSRETSENRNRAPTTGSLPAADLFDPNPGDPFSVNPAFSGARSEAQVDTVGVYAFDTLKLNEQWELVGGLRWDRFATDSTSIATNGVATEFNRVDKTLNGQGAIVYKPVPNGSVYVSYGTSSNPSAEFLTLAANNANTEPEKTRSYEIGTKWDLFGNLLSATAAIFRTEKTNARITDPLGGTALVLDGEQRVDGFEVGLSGSITDRWKVFGGYTYLKSEIIKAATPAEVGKEFPNIAPHNLSLWTTYDLTEYVGVGFGATYQDRRYANTLNDRVLPDYWRFDAMASYQLTEHVGLRLNLLNLTDETIYDSTHNGQHALVAPGRTALLTAVFNY